MILGLLSGCGGGAEPVSSTPEELVATLDISETWKQELLHAARLGMPMGKVQQEKISGAEMMELLDWFVEYAKPEALDDWKNQLPLLRESNAALSRFDAMAAWYLAAQAAGRDYLKHNYSIMEMMDSVNHSWDENYITWEFFDGFDGPDFDGGAVGPSHLDGACYYYNLARPSYYSGEYPFALDTVTNSFTPHVQPTYAEALLAIVRLISSANPELFVSEPTEAEAEYLNMADEKREGFHAAMTVPPPKFLVRSTMFPITAPITITVALLKRHGRHPSTRFLRNFEPVMRCFWSEAEAGALPPAMNGGLLLLL